MQKMFTFFEKQVDIGQPYIRLLMIIFAAAVLAKGAVLFRGYAIDDYSFTSGVSSGYIKLIFTQGRYFMAATERIVDLFGCDISDMYFSLGIVTLFLQAAFVVSILRFVGLENSPSAGLVGALIIAHPYLTEIFTFRRSLPSYSTALIFSIIALEMAAKSPVTWRTRAISLLATFAMLLTYQSFLNYFPVAIIFAFIFGQVLHNKNGQSSATKNVYRERAITLTIISTVSGIAFVLMIWLTKALGLIPAVSSRASFIAFDMIPERIGQISSSLVSIYWSAEPIFPDWLKKLVALMLVLSIVIVFRHLLSGKRKGNYISNIFFVSFAFLLLLPASLGVIIPFGDWWPALRIIAHVSIIIGLTFLLADSCMRDSGSRFLKSAIFISRIIVLVGFIFISNQILADQQRINQWDKMMANRIISRLEMHPNFSKVKYVHINGGSWDFPATFRTMQYDMNVSAFFPAWSKVYLLSEVSGYRFEQATGSKAAIGETFCEARQPWPHAESITVDNDLAIICLKK
jgi:branched-subunit amino acid transport protein